MPDIVPIGHWRKSERGSFSRWSKTQKTLLMVMYIEPPKRFKTLWAMVGRRGGWYAVCGRVENKTHIGPYADAETAKQEADKHWP